MNAAVDRRIGTGNIVRLSLAQGLAGANSTVLFATGGIVGSTLAPSPFLATLPISIFVVGMTACTLPAGFASRRWGRRVAFLLGAGCGVLIGLISALAVVLGLFWLFCLGAFFGGAYAAVVLSFRFAAADCVGPERRPHALSAVMAGGVFAGVIGPQLVNVTMHMWSPYLFAATFLAQAGVAVLSGIILAGVRLPAVARQERTGGRHLAEIARQSAFVMAVICGVVSYLLMNFLMTSAPLAMHLCGLSQEDADLGLQWHVIAMYGPSFFTGRLITRFGAVRVVVTGLLLIGASAAVGLGGIDVAHFWLTLILLGLGWNFGFVGASALVLECHRPEERTLVQAFNDFVVFGSVAVGSFASGGLLAGFGWNAVLWLTFLPILIAFGSLAWQAARRDVARVDWPARVG